MNHPTTETIMAGVVTETLEQKLAELENLRKLEQRLHAKQCHPDYEYDTTETGRKSGESKMPEGNGWQPNVWAVDGERNWIREDYTETEYWMRLKSCALADDRSPFDLEPITLAKIGLSTYLQCLRERFPKSYMPSATGQVEHTSKPHYVDDPREILDLHRLSGTYVYSPGPSYRAPNGQYPNIVEGVIYCVVELSAQPLRILTSLQDPEKGTWACTKRGNGEWGSWHQWFGYLPICIHELKEQLDVYG